MIEVVELCLRGSVPDELYEVVERSFSVMDKIGLENYTLPYEEIAALEDTVYPGATQESMVRLTHEYVRGLLKEHSVFLNDDASLDISTDILEALMLIQEYESPQEVIDAIDSCDDAIEALGEALSLVSKYNAEDIMIALDTVNYGILKRIKEVVVRNEKKEQDDEVAEMQKKIHDYVIDLWNFLGRPKYPFMDAVFSGIPMGIPYNVYAGMNRELFQIASPKDAAAMMLLMSRASLEGHEVLLRPVAENMERYITDFKQMTNIDVALRDIFTRYVQDVEKRTAR